MLHYGIMDIHVEGCTTCPFASKDRFCQLAMHLHGSYERAKDSLFETETRPGRRPDGCPLGNVVARLSVDRPVMVPLHQLQPGQPFHLPGHEDKRFHVGKRRIDGVSEGDGDRPEVRPFSPYTLVVPVHVAENQGHRRDEG